MTTGESPGPWKLLRTFLATTRQLVASSDVEQTVARYLASLAANRLPPECGRAIVVEVVEDAHFLGLLGVIAGAIQAKTPARMERFFFRSLNVGEWNSLARFLNARLLVGPLLSRKWGRLYRSFAQGTAYRSTSFRPWQDCVDVLRARRIWRSLRRREDLLALHIDGVPVGDLVNDSYLRFRPRATVELGDSYLLLVLWQACRDVRRARSYFESAKPSLFLTTYSTYVQHGIAVRVALAAGVAVLSFGNWQEFAKRLTLADWMHTRDPDGYASGFERLDDPAAKLAEAEQALSRRMAGELDAATGYMRESAYAQARSDVPDVAGAVVVFLHDFYDSPHIYRDMVFPDFWEWTCFTLDALVADGTQFLVKPHPNQVALSTEVMSALLQRYPGLAIVPTGVTARQLALAGMRCAVTVYGTIAHEMAFLGVPTISCARHPHASFNFCVTATTRAGYREALRVAHGPMDFDGARAREESLRFYHMHNSNLGPQETELRDRYLALLRAHDAGTIDAAGAVAALRALAELPGFDAFVAKCVEIIAADQRPAEPLG